MPPLFVLRCMVLNPQLYHLYAAAIHLPTQLGIAIVESTTARKRTSKLGSNVNVHFDRDSAC